MNVNPTKKADPRFQLIGLHCRCTGMCFSRFLDPIFLMICILDDADLNL